MPTHRIRRLTLFFATLWGTIFPLNLAFGQSSRGVLYSASGPELTRYDLDPETATLIKRNSIRLPANVQYAWPHPSHKYLYIVWSDGGAATAAPGATVVPSGKIHGLGSFRIDPRTGDLQQMGASVALPSRPIHVSVDLTGTHVLTAYNDPSGLTVHRLNPDGTLGALVKQPNALDTGIYAHQIRVDPSSKTAILVTRGNGPTKDKAEDPGGVKIFRYADGVLTNLTAVAPNGGINFQPRHLDFHPTQPWAFLSLERQAELQVYRMKDGLFDGPALFTKHSVADPARKTLRQNAGTVHVHPNGQFIYQANRSATVDAAGRHIDGGGENTIAVYSINQKTGEPILIQNAETHGAEPRTFALDPSSRMLVAANQTAIYTGPGTQKRPANLAVFRVRQDGKLDFVRTYDVDTTAGTQFWMGIVTLP